MRRRPLALIALLTTAVAGAVLGTGSSADGARVPNVTYYKATLDVAGLVTIRAFQDTTRECMQGRDLAIDYTDEFELGKPRKVEVFAGPGGVVVSTARAPGGVVHEGKVRNYAESNECPPRSPVLPREPECSGQAEGRAAARSVPRSNCTVTGKIFVSVRRVR